MIKRNYLLTKTHIWALSHIPASIIHMGSLTTTPLQIQKIKFMVWAHFMLILKEIMLPTKEIYQVKAEIPMGISKSWNGLIISWNEKFISLKVSWPSWTELCGALVLAVHGALGLAVHDALGFDPHFRGSFNFIYNFYYIDSVSIFRSGVLGFWGLYELGSHSEALSTASFMSGSDKILYHDFASYSPPKFLLDLKIFLIAPM